VFQYLTRIGIALSVLLNVILGGNSNQTFSARNWEWKINGKPNIAWIIDMMFLREKSHCETSWTFWKTIQRYYIDKNQFE
jgi:hypothetical protein